MKKFLFIFFLIIHCCTSTVSCINIVRDAEIEEILTDMVKPIFKIAGLNPESLHIYVINSEVINAFTIGNGYIFITTGLLLRFRNPLHIIGIMAHETAHIAAGHINRQMGTFQRRAQNFNLAMLVGILGTILTGSEKPMALFLGYALTDERLYLRFSRDDELAADSFAAMYLEKLGYSVDALIDVFRLFRDMEILNGEVNLPVYIRTHPKSDNRISALQSKRSSKNNLKTNDDQLRKRYNHLSIKLKAYLGKIDYRTITQYDDDYSKAIYFHRIGKSQEAIGLLQKLLVENPNNTYYKETLAQIMYETGQLNKSIEIYEQIYNNKTNILIKIDYANALIQADQKLDIAISILESVKYEETLNSDVYRLLATAYGKKNREGLSMFMLANEQMLLQNYDFAHDLLKACLHKLNPKTEASYIKKAQYLKELIERERNT
jgi:predicted Zn-dependent protease